MTLKESKEFVEWLAKLFCYLVAIISLVSISPILRDDSDEQGWFGKRSGVEIVTDALTGCQYLRTKEGLVMRMNASGYQVGCRGVR